MARRLASQVASIIAGSAAFLVLLGCAGSRSAAPANSIASLVVDPLASASSAPPPVDPNSFRTADYLRIGVLDAVHAADAYALGYTGQGVTIGIVDFNFVFSSNMVNFAPGSVGP